MSKFLTKKKKKNMTTITDSIKLSQLIINFFLKKNISDPDSFNSKFSQSFPKSSEDKGQKEIKKALCTNKSLEEPL